VHGVDKVEGALENLAGAGVDHGPLKRALVSGIDLEGNVQGRLTRIGELVGTQEMKIILELQNNHVSRRSVKFGDVEAYRLPSVADRVYSTS
jgi:hypothetical protein